MRRQSSRARTVLKVRPAEFARLFGVTLRQLAFPITQKELEQDGYDLDDESHRERVDTMRSRLRDCAEAGEIQAAINAARTTVSQEAVQEYQVTTNSYLPEFGRATGGIVNIVTKGGTNDFSGNVFGFIRHKSIQARNAFAPVIDGDPNKKPPYTRVQYGFTFGGPLVRDRMFFFTSFEQRRRQESGFFTADIIGNATESVTIGAPFLPLAQTFTNLTPAQAAYIQSTLTTNPSVAIAYAHLASIGGQTALNGASSLINFLPGLGVPQGQVIGGRFVLSGMPVPLTRNADGELIAFRPLAQLRRIFPISEDTTFTSARLDHQINDDHRFSMRFGYNPSTINGITVRSTNPARPIVTRNTANEKVRAARPATGARPSTRSAGELTTGRSGSIRRAAAMAWRRPSADIDRCARQTFVAEKNSAARIDVTVVGVASWRAAVGAVAGTSAAARRTAAKKA